MSLNIFPLQSVTRRCKLRPSLLQYAYKNRNQGHFNDITIQSNDISISANRMVLSCYCSFFEQIFTTKQIIKSSQQKQMIQFLTFHLLMENLWNFSFNTFTLVKYA